MRNAWHRYRTTAVVFCFLLAAAPLSLSEQLKPSFDCAAARAADESAICANSHLAELDQLVFEGYRFLKKNVPSSDTKVIGAAVLNLRRTCGSDPVCIQLAQQRGIATYQHLGAELLLPAWATVEGKMNSTSLYIGTGADKLMVGRHSGEGTIIDFSGIDTANALVTLRRDVDDVAEDCSRSFGDGSSAPSSIEVAKRAACVVSAMSRENGAMWSRKANCSSNEVWVFDGKASLVRIVVEDQPPGSTSDKLARTDWDGDTGGADGIEVILATFEFLCPSKYKLLFEGLVPN